MFMLISLVNQIFKKRSIFSTKVIWGKDTVEFSSGEFSSGEFTMGEFNEEEFSAREFG